MNGRVGKDPIICSSSDDHILVRLTIRSVKDVRVSWDAEIGSDHFLLEM